MSADGSLYARWMNRWEENLCFRATNRVVRPFEWGLDWAERWPAAREIPRAGLSPAEWLKALGRRAIERSEEFFGYQTPTDYKLRDGVLRFTSPVHTPYPENNFVHGQWFPAPKTHKAVLVLPHWNAPRDAHNALARVFQKFDTPALRLSLPYHDFRMPAELERADYAVSSNVGRTIDAMRQSVIDIRAAVDWLALQGAERIAIVGTSLGSCSAFLASAHDERLVVNAFNHCSTYFADVVWTGLSTIHVRQGLEGDVDLDTLRDIWLPNSRTAFFDKFAARKKKSMFLRPLRHDVPLRPLAPTIAMAPNTAWTSKKLSCLAAITPGRVPYKYLDGYHLVSFVLRNL